MIYFEISTRQNIIDAHYSELKPYLEEKLAGSTLNKTLKKFLTDNLKRIITSRPVELLKIHKEFISNKAYNSASDGKLKRIFNYGYFSKKSDNGRYDAYTLAERLGVRTCLYCNRNYTITVIKGTRRTDKITRPEFDHFFDKGRNPLLALSIYNLIPSCKICNSSLKGRRQFNLKNNLHPYLDNAAGSYRFKYKPHDTKAILGETANLEIEIEIDKSDRAAERKITNSKKLFKLEEIFSAHTEELKDLFDIKHRYSQRYFEELFKRYETLGLSYDEVYKTVFGTYHEETDFSKRPFSKLKKDILKELGII